MSGYFESEFDTDEVGVVEEWLRAHYGSFDILDTSVRYSEDAAGDDRFSLRRVRADSDFALTAEVDSIFVVTSSAGYRWEMGEHRGEFSVSPAVVQPGDRFRGHVSHAHMDVLGFDTDALQSMARTIYGDDDIRVRFDAPLPVSTHLRDDWIATMRWARTQMPLLGNDLVRASVVRATALATLSAFPLHGDPRERRASAIEQAAIYRTARTFIDEHASLPITVDDAAAAAGVSAEGLRRAFAAHARLVSTPAEYLALVRTNAAHADLLAADPTGTTVATVALRWGFTHLADFRARYLAQFGVRPETTLAR